MAYGKVAARRENTAVSTLPSRKRQVSAQRATPMLTAWWIKQGLYIVTPTRTTRRPQNHPKTQRPTVCSPRDCFRFSPARSSKTFDVQCRKKRRGSSCWALLPADLDLRGPIRCTTRSHVAPDDAHSTRGPAVVKNKT